MTNVKPRGAAQADNKESVTERIRGFFPSKGEETVGTKFLFRLTALAVAMAMVVLGAGVAWADTLNVNDVVTGGNTSLAAGSSGSATIWLEVTNGTPSTDQNGCNIDSDNPGTVTLSTSASAVVSVAAPSSVQISDCGSRYAVAIGYSVSSSASVGQSATLSASITGGKTNTSTKTYSYDTSDSFTVTVAGSAGDTTAPTGTVSINAGADYTNSTAATLTLSATDAVGVTHYRKAQAADCSTLTATDSSWSTWTAYATSVSHELGASNGSKTVCIQFKDAAGNISTTAQDSIFLDTTAPSISVTGATKGTGATATTYTADTWTNLKVTVSFACTDNSGGSGTSSTIADVVKDEEFEGNLTTPASGCVDAAGNTATSQGSFGPVKIDRTAPGNFTFVGGPAAGGTYYFGDVPARPTCTADDALSLLNSTGCVVHDYSSSIGNHTMTARATDNAGNQGSATRSYSVLSWTLKGFYSPVDMDGITNVVKAGSTVPLKFEVFAGTTEFISTDVVGSFTVTRKTCGALTGTTDAIENYSTGATSLRYDETGGQFIQNWKVPTGANLCYEVVLTTDDGSSKTAYFKTK